MQRSLLAARRALPALALLTASTAVASACARAGEDGAGAEPAEAAAATPAAPSGAEPSRTAGEPAEATPRGLAGALPPPSLGEAERAAIQRARGDSRYQSADTSPESATPGAQDPKAAAAASELTPAERRTIRDDPAARADIRARQPEIPAEGGDPEAEGAPAPPVEPPPPSMRHDGEGTEVRPGVHLYPGSQELRVVDLAIATSIKSRTPQGVAQHYAVMPDRFLCFSVFDSRAEGEADVSHVWRRDGRVVSRVELSVGRSPKWRTWSRQRVREHWQGRWSCEVVDREGRRLGLAEFSAGAESAQ